MLGGRQDISADDLYLNGIRDSGIAGLVVCFGVDAVLSVVVDRKRIRRCSPRIRKFAINVKLNFADSYIVRSRDRNGCRTLEG